MLRDRSTAEGECGARTRRGAGERPLLRLSGHSIQPDREPHSGRGAALAVAIHFAIETGRQCCATIGAERERWACASSRTYPCEAAVRSCVLGAIHPQRCPSNARRMLGALLEHRRMDHETFLARPPSKTSEWLHEGMEAGRAVSALCAAIIGTGDVAPDRRGTDTAGREHPDPLALPA